MNKVLIMAPIVLAAVVSGCTHPEDLRWKASETAKPLAKEEMPSVSVYACSPPKQGAHTGVRDLSDRGQAALIEALAKSPGAASDLRKAVSTPFESEGGGGVFDRSRLSRTVVISVLKGAASQPGDRLMRTVVTIAPHRLSGDSTFPFEFEGYTVAATDTKVQDIAHLETTTEASLATKLAPKIGNFGDNEVSSGVTHTQKSTADIVQQYENLGVDIQPTALIVTRESERGLDVVGNTLVALTLATPDDSDRILHNAYL